ncbi:MAG TPA: chromate transporter [Bacillota bacterium]
MQKQSEPQRLWELFWAFLKIGSFTFGGGLAMLPLIHKEVVDNRKWLADKEMVDILAISQSVPGVIAINSAIFVGHRVKGVSGAVAAAIGVTLPAFLSIILILLVLTNLRQNPYVDKAFAGIRAASAALILLSGIKLGQSILKERSGYGIAIVSFIAIAVLNISAVWAIIFGGMAGFILYRNGERSH